jgi:hypothetical protein
VAKSKRKWPVIAGIAFIAIFVAAMAWTTLGNAQFKCKVCISYHGQTECGNGAGTTKQEAERIASDVACNNLTHGMTELMQCQQGAPREVTWKQ